MRGRQPPPFFSSSRAAFTQGGLAFTVSVQAGLAVLAAAPPGAPRSAVAAFLDAASAAAADAAPAGASLASLPPYALDAALSPILGAAAAAAASAGGGAAARAARELEAARAAAVDTIDRALARGDRVAGLVAATDNLSDAAALFGRRATALRRSERWRAARLKVGVGAAVVGALYAAAASVCGARLRCGGGV